MPSNVTRPREHRVRGLSLLADRVEHAGLAVSARVKSG